MAFFQYFIYFIKRELTKCLCTYISVSDCTDLTQAACYWTQKAIAHETFHITQIIHTVQRYIHTYILTNIHSYSCIYLFFFKSGNTMK